MERIRGFKFDTLFKKEKVKNERGGIVTTKGGTENFSRLLFCEGRERRGYY